MEIGAVRHVDINSEMRSAYLDYAMSVIVSRALPDARDGLKPVHRRILYAMHDMGIRANSAYRKSARIVGDVLGKYHPHGDMAVYEAMARMAQPFSMRYTLVDGQGNFGSIDGDSPAAMRYTEARLQRMSEEMLIDIDKDTVDFVDNFDNSLQEPKVLPARLPNLLLNGSSGIAVGMATNIPPHNLREVVSTLVHLIDNYDEIEEISIEELMEHLSGPDFPTGGIIIGREGIRQAYSTGRGRLVMRGKAQIEENSKGRAVIIITEIPYQVNKASLVERIAELVRIGKIDSISDLRDESDRNGMRIVIELKRRCQPQLVLNQLYKYTVLQSTFGVQMLALVDDEPRYLPLKKVLQIYLDHRQEVITRRTQYELDKARHRAHVLEGLLIALANLDDVIQTIRESPDAEQARERLISRFNLSEIQAQAILDMQLRRLAALERQKIEDEHKALKEHIDYLEDLLASPRKILDLIKEDLQEVAEKYGDERRTTIAVDMQEEFNEEDLVADERVLITLTERGYIKRVTTSVYRTLGRGRRGVSGQSVREEDEVVTMLSAGTLQTVLFFSDRGKVYSQRVFQVPEAGRTDSGVSIYSLLPLDQGEHITAAVVVPDFKDANYCTMTTAKGKMKRVPLSEFESVRYSGLIAMGLADDDYLGWVRLTSGDDDIILVTEGGNALRMSETQVRSMGRQAAGVRGMRLRAGDRIASMDVVEPGGDLLIVTEKGFGKRTSLEKYNSQNRGGGGVATINKRGVGKVGKIISARVVHSDDEITIISSGGILLRQRVSGFHSTGRASLGVRLMNLEEGDTVASLARIAAADLEDSSKKPA